MLNLEMRSMLSENNEFQFFPPNPSIMYLSSLISLARMLNRNGSSQNPCFVPHLDFQYFIMKYVICGKFLQIPFIQIMETPPYSNFVEF